MKQLSIIITMALMLLTISAPSKAQLVQIFGAIAAQKAVGSVMTPKAGAPKPKPLAKIGDEATTNQIRLAVTKIEQLTSYTTTFLDGKLPLVITPKEGQRLIVVSCYAKNATMLPQELVFASNLIPNTAVIDDKKFAYRPLTVVSDTLTFDGYDVKADELSPVGAKIAPGRDIKFAIVFGVPNDFKPSVIVFSALNYVDRNLAVARAVDLTFKID